VSWEEILYGRSDLLKSSLFISLPSEQFVNDFIFIDEYFYAQICDRSVEGLALIT